MAVAMAMGPAWIKKKKTRGRENRKKKTNRSGAGGLGTPGVGEAINYGVIWASGSAVAVVGARA